MTAHRKRGQERKLISDDLLIVNTSYPPLVGGGAELAVCELAEGIVERGIPVTVVCLRPPSATKGVLTDEISGVRVVRIPTKAMTGFGGADSRGPLQKVMWHLGELFRFSTNRQLRRIIRATNPSVVHLNNIAGFGWMALWVARKNVTVRTVHDYYTLCTSATGQHHGHECSRTAPRCRVLKQIFTLRALKPHALIGVSNYILERHVANGISGSRVNRAIYTMPKLEARPTQIVARDSASGPHNQTHIGFLGRVAPDKGVDTLVEGFNLAAQSPGGKSLVLHLAGDVDEGYRETLSRTYSHLITSGKLLFEGHVSAAAFLETVDFSVVPTQWAEPFGRVIIEALACSRPVVYSATGALPEAFRLYGGTGIEVSEFRSSAAWKDAILEASAGRWTEVAPHPTQGIPSTVEQHLHLYEQLLQ